MAETLGGFEQLVLFAILKRKQEAYGAAIRDEIEESTGREVAAGAIYVTLERLENRGLVRSHWGEPTATRGGRRRRYYELQSAGARVLEQTYSALRGLAEPMLAELRSMAGSRVTDA